MRIVAGTAGGLTLTVPKGVELRPSMDRVRGAIFSMLGESVPGARVLDLFAGTGSLGLEALSRGAAHGTFVEKDGRAVKAIRANLERARLTGEIVETDIFSYLDRLAPAAAFDLVFADPPYAKKEGERDFGAELLASESLHRAVVEDGLLILEHLPGASLTLGTHWECLRQRQYGATEVAILRRSH